MERFFHFKEAGHAIHFNVVDVAHGFFLDFFHHKVNEGFLAPLAFSVGFFCMTEAAGKDKGGFMFFWAQVDVAGTFGKAVFFADNGHEAQGDVQEENLNQALQDLGLLSVFEAVVGAVTLGEVKDLGTDRSDAAKMNRSCPSAKDLRNRTRDLNPGHILVGIHFARGWRKDEVGAFAFRHLAVTFQSPGICSVVFRRSKLCRIDKDGDDDEIVFCPGCLDEGSVSFMKSAHGGHKTNGFSFFLDAADLISKFLCCVTDVHR